MWVLKELNMDLDEVRRKRMLDIQEQEELREHTYKNAKMYKERTKKFHDSHIVNKTFESDMKMLLFNPRLNFFSRKAEITMEWTL